MMAWFFLIIASCMEVCWTFTLKLLDMKSIFRIRPSNFFTPESGAAILPLIGYIVFGLLNILAITRAMKDIPAGTAFAVWMGLAMVMIKIVDIVYFKQPWSSMQIVFTSLVLIGIVGLKVFDVKPAA